MNSSKLFVGLVLLLLGGLAGYFIGAGYPVSLERDKDVDVRGNEAGEETVLQEVESELFGISFSYLSGQDGFTLVEPPSAADAAIWSLIDTDAWQELQDDEGPREGPTAINIVVVPAPEGLVLEEWLQATQEANLSLGSGELEAFEVDGQGGFRFMWEGLYRGQTVAIAQGDWVYLFAVTYLEEDDGMLSAFDDLLSSVSFSG